MNQETPSTNPPKSTRKFVRSMWGAIHHLQLFYLHSDFFEQWRRFTNAIQKYWAIYGGWHAALRSPYLHLSLFLTIISALFWKNGVSAAEITLSTVPNLLGFTVGALAIVLAFSSAKTFSTLAEKGEPLSFFMKLTASLIHFILIQALALICGAVTKISGANWLEVITLFFLFYAVLCTAAAGIHLFHTAGIYNAVASLDDDKPTDA